MKIQIRSDSVVVEGYVNAVDRDSRVIPSPLGKFVERVLPRTFERALIQADDVKLKLNHAREIGSTKQGNLELREDAIGLYARAVVTDAEVIRKARNKELRGWSFGFYDKGEPRMEDLENGLKRRYLEDIALSEVSILDSSRVPAYIGTSIEARNGSETMLEQRGMEDTVEVADSTPPPDLSGYRQEIQQLRGKDVEK